MDALWITVTFLTALVLGLVALVHFARHDTFAGPGVGHRERDELGTATYGREAAGGTLGDRVAA
ncbi:MAG TPA: hypothetical protein VHO29_04195 [Marmoricola sp.]|nr:hypothetical protein [Marmoricola sp.]